MFHSMFNLFQRRNGNNAPPAPQANEINELQDFHPSRHAKYKLMAIEIKECIDLLEKSKKKLPSYLHMKACQEKFFNAYSWFILLVTAGSSLSFSYTMMYRLHSLLVNKLQQQLAPLLPQLSSASAEFDTFMAWYNGELSKFSDAVEVVKNNCTDVFRNRVEKSWTHFISYFPFWCPEIKLSLLDKPYGRFADYCSALTQYKYNIYRAGCHHALEVHCEAGTAYFDCVEEKFPAIEQEKRQFEMSISPNVTYHTEAFNKIKNAFTALSSQSTWEPASTVLFAATGTAWTAYLSYLFYRWYAAKEQYNKDIKEICPLDKCLDRESQLRIRSLTTNLDGFYLTLFRSFNDFIEEEDICLLQGDVNEHLFCGKDENGRIGLYTLKNLVLPPAWANKKIVFISTKDKIYHTLKKYHTDTYFCKGMSYEKLIEKLKFLYENNYEKAITLLLTARRYYIPDELSFTIANYANAICEEKDLNPRPKF